MSVEYLKGLESLTFDQDGAVPRRKELYTDKTSILGLWSVEDLDLTSAKIEK